MGLVRVKGVRRVEYEPGWGWIACDQCGGRIGGDDFVWNSRAVARTVAMEADMFGPFAASEHRP